MQRIATVLFVLATLLLACDREVRIADRSAGEAASRDSVIAVVERLRHAAIEKNVDEFMALWERSDSVVYSRHGRTFVGWEEIWAEHDRAFSGTDRWTAEAGAVYAHSLGPNAGVGTSFTRLSSLEESNWFITTLTVRASGGAWRIVQGHASYPPTGVTPVGEAER